MSTQTFVTALAGAAVACYATAQLAPSLKKSKKSAAAGPLKNSAFVFIKVRGTNDGIFSFFFSSASVLSFPRRDMNA